MLRFRWYLSVKSCYSSSRHGKRGNLPELTWVTVVLLSRNAISRLNPRDAGEIASLEPG